MILGIVIGIIIGIALYVGFCCGVQHYHALSTGKPKRTSSNNIPHEVKEGRIHYEPTLGTNLVGGWEGVQAKLHFGREE